MNIDLDSGFESGALLASVPLSRQAIARLVLAAVVLVDAVAFIIPQAVTIVDLRREIAELEERQRSARRLAEGAADAAAFATHRPEAQSRLNPRDLLPTVSALAHQEGIRIVTVKQSAVDKQGPARRLHLRARAPFENIVALIDTVPAAIPFAKVEDLLLRNVAASTQQDAGIELEYVLSVPPADLPAEGSAQAVESGTR